MDGVPLTQQAENKHFSKYLNLNLKKTDFDCNGFEPLLFHSVKWTAYQLAQQSF
jgi:hypothetical protein